MVVLRSRPLQLFVTTVWLVVLALSTASTVVVDEAVHGLTNVDMDDGTCATTVTATTTLGASLMQMASARVNNVALKEDVGIAKVLALASVMDRSSPDNSWNTSSPKISTGHDQNRTLFSKERVSFFPFRIHTALETVSSLLQTGNAMGHSALLACISACTSSLLASTSAIFLIFLMILCIGACAFTMIANSSGRGGLGSSLASEAQLPPELIARGKAPQQSSRNLFQGSPQLSVRNARAFPRVAGSSKLPPPLGKRSPAGRSGQPFAKVMDGMSSSDDERQMTKRIATPSEMQCCPDLVVPQHCECILLLPLDLGKTHSSFAITDVNGSPVLNASPQAASMMNPWRATVTTATGEHLVQCCEARQGPEAEFHILRAGGQLFAKLTYSPSPDGVGDRYLLTLRSGAVLHFWGNFDNCAVNITDDGNRLLSTTEIGPANFDPEGKYCRLRVAPLADVGLALCGLLCIGQHMTSQRRVSIPERQGSS